MAKKKLKVRLIGPEGSWREEKEQLIAKRHDVQLLVKNDRAKDTVAHEVDLIRQADVVVVNAEQELDRETIVLMTCAKEAGKAVLTVLPLRLHAHEPRNGKVWINPFFQTYSDKIVRSFDELPEKLPKGFEQLAKESMRELSSEHKKLYRQIEKFCKWIDSARSTRKVKHVVK